MYAICKNLKFFGLMMTRKELKHVAKWQFLNYN
jgi:hypothetical protein